MISPFRPTVTDLFEFYQDKMMQRGLSRIEIVKNYPKWCFSQQREALKLAFSFDANLIRLAPYSKSPPPDYEYRPLTYTQAMKHLRENGGWFGWRGNDRFAHLDFDSLELTPELERLAYRTLTTATPNGYTFTVRE